MLTLFDILIQLATFAIVFLAVILAQKAVGAHLAVQRRLQSDGTKVGATALLKPNTVSNGFLAWVQASTSIKDPKENSKLRRDLALAGFDHPAAPVWYVIVRFSLAIGLPAAAIVLAGVTGHPLTGLAGIVYPAVLGGVGLLGPRLFVSVRTKDSRTQIENEFPDALDLLVVCVEAGLGMEAAFVRVAREVAESHPRIAVEFSRMAEELSAGRGRAEALRAMADRADVETVRAFVALLIQTDALGVSIAQSLRTYSNEMRQKRYLTAEEKAMRIPVLMTMPIVACFMPVMLVVLLLPPIIDAIRIVGPAMAGH